MALRVRWLGTVPYREALALQHALFRNGHDDHLLLLEHPHVFTHGRRADVAAHVHVDPESVGAELVLADRGGDVTYHGPGQLVGYPIVNVANTLGALDHVGHVQQVVATALRTLGLDDVGTLPDYPGVWVGVSGDNPRKICAIGVRLSRGRTMHGFALNVDPDLRYMRDYIVPCGIEDRPVTSLAEEGIDVEMRTVVDAIVAAAAPVWGDGEVERQDVAWRHRPEDLSAFSRGEGPGAPVRTVADHGAPMVNANGTAAAGTNGAAHGADAAAAVTEAPEAPTSIAGRPRLAARMADAGIERGLDANARKPIWLRPKVHHGPEVLALRQKIRHHQLVTVCEEAGCPNLSECWSDGTATFMVLGERCTRACGFCLVDTRKPMAPQPDEPRRVAEAVADMGITHAVLTMVSRDDLPDGGMGHMAACVRAIRARVPGCRVETLISDAKGDGRSLDILFAEHPDILNHNVETTAALQRAVRPSAGYARSLGVLSRAKAAGMTTKSGLIVGMGETVADVDGALADLAAIGVSIVTIGQYLRPTSNHLPVVRWVEPNEFTRWKLLGESLGIGHVEASPLTRSSYHARQAAAALEPLAQPG